MGQRIYIPEPLREGTMERLHRGHLGLGKMRGRARETVWWPRLSQDLKSYIKKCRICLEHHKNRPEPLLQSEIPMRPWQMVGTDFAEVKGKKYLIVVDYLSSYPEVIEVSSTAAKTVIPQFKKIFARHGVPETLRSDNGPPFNGSEFREFAAEWKFRLVTSSPGYPQSNGKAEVTVKKMKEIIEKEKNLEKGLLAYRTAALDGGPSPAELLMGRKLKTDIPILGNQLEPAPSKIKAYRRQLAEKQEKTKVAYNKFHRTKSLPDLKGGDEVWVTDMK